MYCKHCYATIPDGDNFCPSCGKAVNAQPVAQPAAPAPTHTPMMPPRRGRLVRPSAKPRPSASR
ncbi:MAG: zinc ribbon domain-containing protein [Clostridia bacterium]|nr:zinc ribbon domain-containing protein [Clostridia bacterium]